MLAGALILAAVALVVVVALAGRSWRFATARAPPTRATTPAAVEEDLERSLAAIREIEMDHRAGNLSDEDFAELDRAERVRAVELMRAARRARPGLTGFHGIR